MMNFKFGLNVLINACIVLILEVDIYVNLHLQKTPEEIPGMYRQLCFDAQVMNRGDGVKHKIKEQFVSWSNGYILMIKLWVYIGS